MTLSVRSTTKTAICMYTKCTSSRLVDSLIVSLCHSCNHVVHEGLHTMIPVACRDVTRGPNISSQPAGPLTYPHSLPDDTHS